MIKKIFVLTVSVIIWFYWWLILFLVGMPCFFLTFILPFKTRDFFVNLICGIQTYAAFVIPRLKGIKRKAVPFPVIYVANHVSIFDLFICGCILPGNPRGLELKKFFDVPLYGWLIKRFGMIPIDISSKSGILRSLDNAAQKLIKKERSILVMPEGARTKTGKLGKFKNGAFYLSRKYNIPVQPVVFKGLFEINNSTGIAIKPGFFDLYFEETVYPSVFKSDDEMSAYAENVIRKRLEQ